MNPRKPVNPIRNYAIGSVITTLALLSPAIAFLTRARERGRWAHPRVRMNTIARSEATAVRLQRVCMV